MFMGNRIFFSKLVTKDLTAVDSSRRLFEGVLTVEMKDRQNEITIRDELLKVLPIWMARGAPITDTHSNRVIGKGINFAATTIQDSEGNHLPAITIQGEIFKDYELDNEIWKAIKDGKYKGLSFGGATKASRRPVQQSDGSIAYALKDLEHYEVAVCEEPAVPLALITQHNALAKAIAGYTEDRGNGLMCIKCSKFGCYIDKNGEEFSDTKGGNTPQKDEEAEALEADRSQGPNQDNGSTYRGTDKGRHAKDDGVYSRTEQIGVDEPPATPKLKDEKAIDEDNKEMLEEADLKEEKKLEHAKDTSEGPVQANKVLGALAAGAGKLLSGAGKEVAEEGATMAGAAAAGMANNINDEDTCKSLEEKDPTLKPSKRNIFDEHHGVMSGKVPNTVVGVDTTFMKPEEARQHERTHLDRDVAEKLKGLLDALKPKTPKVEVPKTPQKKETMLTSEQEKDRYWEKYRADNDKVKAQLDLLNLRLKFEPKEYQPGQKQPRGKPLSRDETSTYNPGEGYGGGSGRERHTKPTKKPIPNPPKVTQEDKDKLDSLRERLGLPKPSSKPSTSFGTGRKPKPKPVQSYSRTIAGKNPFKKAMEIIESIKADYDTDGVVRDHEKKNENDVEKRDEGHFRRYGHYPKIRPTHNPLRREPIKEECINCVKERKEYPNKPSLASLEAQNPQPDMPKRGMGGKVKSDGQWSEPSRGGFAGREPGITREGEGRSIHDVNQPKHVNEPYKDEEAEGVKKETGNIYHPGNAKFNPANPTHQKELSERWNDNLDNSKNKPKITNADVCGSHETFKAFLHDKGDYITKPFAGYKDFADCVARNKDKGDPEAYCGQIKNQVEKEHRDPQFEANNSEDGVNGKLRTDKDEQSEAFKSEEVFDGKNRPKQVISPEAGESYKSTNINDPGMGSGGVRNGGAYDNAQQDTGQKDNPREVKEEKYTGEEDSDTGVDNEKYNKANTALKMLDLTLKTTHI